LAAGVKGLKVATHREDRVREIKENNSFWLVLVDRMLGVGTNFNERENVLLYLL
jgi:hypothetical protein